MNQYASSITWHQQIMRLITQCFDSPARQPLSNRDSVREQGPRETLSVTNRTSTDKHIKRVDVDHEIDDHSKTYRMLIADLKCSFCDVSVARISGCCDPLTIRRDFKQRFRPRLASHSKESAVYCNGTFLQPLPSCDVSLTF